MFPERLLQKINDRIENNALRSLPCNEGKIDFASNDYLGFSRSETIFNAVSELMRNTGVPQNGATGSRLLSGNHQLYAQLEGVLCDFHKSPAAVVFNSGYDANIGFFSCIPQRGDVVLYDELIHASIRDGIQMSNSRAYKFRHNDLVHLKELLSRHAKEGREVYVATEAVFSMDGDSPDLLNMVEIVKQFGAYLVVDEAHAIGVFGNKGEGLIQQLSLQDQVFARIVTFGKALGSHGAAVLGNEALKSYLVNFARSFIYTTALPPHSVATVLVTYRFAVTSGITDSLNELRNNISRFRLRAEVLGLKLRFIESNSPIQCCLISGNQKVKSIASKLGEKGFDVKPIMSPTVAEGEERLRFCLHSYNSGEEISEVLSLLATFVH
ncbi:8-amino-7-oxononanoate synthase [Zhouia spongiae]|uniref:8-amino-7-oxononanoate synthase n=1 Tax=Zhouia spongiae TaxID=2202721 RepID=A0ABY3YQ86_9FLAO|nr:8-amino-7-oxononanoate synthase [Zhouia spongiae]UNY99997.1 8-amino-7-oxononanoate synthase [Zhouia spongiae]